MPLPDVLPMVGADVASRTVVDADNPFTLKPMLASVRDVPEPINFWPTLLSVAPEFWPVLVPSPAWT